MRFQARAGGVQFSEGGGHGLFKTLQASAVRLLAGDGLGRAGARHHILALGIDEVLAIEKLFSGGGVPREGHARATVIAHVAEDHALDIDAGAPVIGDAVQAAIDDGAARVPAFKDSADGSPELLHGVLGKGVAGLFLDNVLVDLDEPLPIISFKFGVQVLAEPFLGLFQFGFKKGVLHTQYHVAVHGDEATVGVPGEAGIAAGAFQRRNSLVIEPQVQDGIHHAGHGDPGPGADG